MLRRRRKYWRAVNLQIHREYCAHAKSRPDLEPAAAADGRKRTRQTRHEKTAGGTSQHQHRRRTVFFFFLLFSRSAVPSGARSEII